MKKGIEIGWLFWSILSVVGVIARIRCLKPSFHRRLFLHGNIVQGIDPIWKIEDSQTCTLHTEVQRPLQRQGSWRSLQGSPLQAERVDLRHCGCVQGDTFPLQSHLSGDSWLQDIGQQTDNLTSLSLIAQLSVACLELKNPVKFYSNLPTTLTTLNLQSANNRPGQPNEHFPLLSRLFALTSLSCAWPEAQGDWLKDLPLSLLTLNLAVHDLTSISAECLTHLSRPESLTSFTSGVAPGGCWLRHLPRGLQRLSYQSAGFKDSDLIDLPPWRCAISSPHTIETLVLTFNYCEVTWEELAFLRQDSIEIPQAELQTHCAWRGCPASSSGLPPREPSGSVLQLHDCQSSPSAGSAAQEPEETWNQYEWMGGRPCRGAPFFLCVAC